MGSPYTDRYLEVSSALQCSPRTFLTYLDSVLEDVRAELILDLKSRKDVVETSAKNGSTIWVKREN